MTQKPDWIAVDWGTTNLRVWAMSNAGHALAEAQSNQGMATLEPTEFEPTLIALIEDWLTDSPIDVIACGMLGARQGWTEAPYIAVPAKPQQVTPIKAPCSDPRLSVHILAGMSQDTPADVMRGEETQIAGYLAANKNFDGIICLPGTHTKWAHISAEEVVSFQTYMTGELFSLISENSVLKHSVQTGDLNPDAFKRALSDTLSRPEKLAARLFSLRAENLLHDLDPISAHSTLSGLLIGAELSASRPYWLGQAITIIGTNPLADLYATALATQGVIAQQVPADDTTLAGLKAAYANLKDPT